MDLGMLLAMNVADDSLNGSRSMHNIKDSDHQHPLQLSLRYFYVTCLTVESVFGTLGNLLVSIQLPCDDAYANCELVQ